MSRTPALCAGGCKGAPGRAVAGCATRSSPLGLVNRQREEPDNQWKAAAFVR